jgi:hypothetical protein
MRKSTLIISAILTAALLFALYSLLSAYQKAIAVAVPSTATAQAEVLQGQATAAPAQTLTAGKITIYDAAAQAVRVMGRSDLYLVLNTQLNGADVYLATFISGDMMYISQDGQVLSTSKVEPISIYQPASHGK